jgi:hypothetical protein
MVSTDAGIQIDADEASITGSIDKVAKFGSMKLKRLIVPDNSTEEGIKTAVWLKSIRNLQNLSFRTDRRSLQFAGPKIGTEP